MKIRARNSEDKLERRQTILDAGLALFGETTFTDLTMSQVAERAGIAKGTLYLYFKTKEELFLELLEGMMLDWIDDFIRRVEATRTSIGADRLARILGDSLDGRETLIRMLTTQGAILEHNISHERARAFKLRVLERMSVAASSLAERSELFNETSAARLLIHVHALVVGLGQMAFPASVTEQVLCEPPLDCFQIDLKKEFTFVLRSMLRGLEGTKE